MQKIKKGEHIPILLRLGNVEITADLTRINNAVGHLQIRYDRKINQPLKEALNGLLEKSTSPKNVVIEIVETGKHQFCILPISGLSDIKPTLSIVSPIFHQINRSLKSQEFTDLTRMIRNIDFTAEFRQSDYNTMIREELIKHHWFSEQTVVAGLGLRCDFQKNGVWVEVEFGNARSYYQDYVKFLVASKFQTYQFGVLLCPTASFASYLCELGKAQAHAKRNDNKQVRYSGMMTYEKAIRELPYFSHFLNAKMIIAGLEVKRQSS
jgi:hypothetical protein